MYLALFSVLIWASVPICVKHLALYFSKNLITYSIKQTSLIYTQSQLQYYEIPAKELLKYRSIVAARGVKSLIGPTKANFPEIESFCNSHAQAGQFRPAVNETRRLGKRSKKERKRNRFPIASRNCFSLSMYKLCPIYRNHCWESQNHPNNYFHTLVITPNKRSWSFHNHNTITCLFVTFSMQCFTFRKIAIRTSRISIFRLRK